MIIRLSRAGKIVELQRRDLKPTIDNGVKGPGEPEISSPYLRDTIRKAVRRSLLRAGTIEDAVYNVTRSCGTGGILPCNKALAEYFYEYEQI